ncbi:hypothetical protein AX17_003154 [Amanita inopinata Kibby_2008]|nr:hypothetical protein AX17_003154 [Amanita inopinata Kibby_2008]
MLKLTDHRILVFDVYGTLADWETGLFNALLPLLAKYPASASWGRKEALLAFASVERDLQAQHPDMLYSDLLANAHGVLEQRLKALSELDTAEEGTSIVEAVVSTEGASTSAATTAPVEGDAHMAFARSIKEWTVFPDSCAALHSLAKHFKLVVLSNVDRESFSYTHARLSEGPSVVLTPRKLNLYSYPENNPNIHWFPQSAPDDNKSPFALVLTAQDVKAYKPSTAGFRTVLQCVSSDPRLLGEEGKSPDEVKERVLVVAQSLPHDHEPASELGIKSVWIDRSDAVMCNEMPEGTKQKWTRKFATLAEMAEEVEEELETDGH